MFVKIPGYILHKNLRGSFPFHLDMSFRSDINDAAGMSIAIVGEVNKKYV